MRLLQTITFAAAMLALFSLVLAVHLGMDDISLAWGLAAGWIIGFFHITNARFIDNARRAIAREERS